MFVRKKTRGEKIYYYLVKSVRKGNKVRQKVIKYLGKKKPNKKEVNSLIEKFG